MKSFTAAYRHMPALVLVGVLAWAAPTLAQTRPDLVPADALGYVQLSDIYQVVEAVMESPEWEALSEIESVQTALMQTGQISAVVQMITGMTWDEFLKAFGRQITFVLMGVSEPPDLALIFDVGASKELAEDALDQFLILMSADADFDATPEPFDYSGVTVNSITFEDGNIVQYGFLNDLMIFALNDGFEPIVDVLQAKTASIATVTEHQEMVEKIRPSGTAYAYLNLQRAIPAIRAAEAAKQGVEIQPAEDEMEAAILKSPLAFAVKLDLLGSAHEAYLRLHAQGPATMFAPLLLQEHAGLASIDFLPAIDGAFIGLQIGDPVQTWTQLAGLAAMMGEDLNAVMNEIEAELGFDLEADLLQALTGEIGVGISLPVEDVKLKDNPIQFAKFQPVLAIGVKDRDRFEAISTKIAPLVQIDRFASSAGRSGAIRRGIVTVDALIPGVALAPWYTFTESLFIASTSRPQLEAIVAQTEKPTSASTEGTFTPSPWVLGYVNAGKLARFIVGQDLDDDLNLPEEIAEKLPDIGQIQIAYGAEQEGVKVTLTTGSGQTWISNLLNALMVVAYAEEGKK